MSGEPSRKALILTMVPRRDGQEGYTDPAVSHVSLPNRVMGGMRQNKKGFNAAVQKLGRSEDGKHHGRRKERLSSRSLGLLHSGALEGLLRVRPRGAHFESRATLQGEASRGGVLQSELREARSVRTPIKGGPWLQSHRGLAWMADAPEVYPYDIQEIAHALSNLCRFAGHTTSFYSVAQHSVIVAQIAMTDGRTRHLATAQIRSLALEALLHDAAEAFCIDLPQPIKHMPQMAGYRELIARTEACIARHFGDLLLEPESVEGELARAIVKHSDLRALAMEKRDLLVSSPFDEFWQGLPTPPPFTLRAQPPEAARRMFLEAWHAYLGVAELGVEECRLHSDGTVARCVRCSAQGLVPQGGGLKSRYGLPNLEAEEDDR